MKLMHVVNRYTLADDYSLSKLSTIKTDSDMDEIPSGKYINDSQEDNIGPVETTIF